MRRPFDSPVLTTIRVQKYRMDEMLENAEEDKDLLSLKTGFAIDSTETRDRVLALLRREIGRLQADGRSTRAMLRIVVEVEALTDERITEMEAERDQRIEQTRAERESRAAEAEKQRELARRLREQEAEEEAESSRLARQNLAEGKICVAIELADGEMAYEEYATAS